MSNRVVATNCFEYDGREFIDGIPCTWNDEKRTHELRVGHYHSGSFRFVSVPEVLTTSYEEGEGGTREEDDVLITSAYYNSQTREMQAPWDRNDILLLIRFDPEGDRIPWVQWDGGGQRILAGMILIPSENERAALRTVPEYLIKVSTSATVTISDTDGRVSVYTAHLDEMRLVESNLAIEVGEDATEHVIVSDAPAATFRLVERQPEVQEVQNRVEVNFDEKFREEETRA